MVQRKNHAASKDAQRMLRKEECVKGMVQRSNYAAEKDVQTMPRKEDCALGMVQRSNDEVEVVMDAQTMPRKKECVICNIRCCVQNRLIDLFCACSLYILSNVQKTVSAWYLQLFSS